MNFACFQHKLISVWELVNNGASWLFATLRRRNTLYLLTYMAVCVGVFSCRYASLAWRKWSSRNSEMWTAWWLRSSRTAWRPATTHAIRRVARECTVAWKCTWRHTSPPASPSCSARLRYCCSISSTSCRFCSFLLRLNDRPRVWARVVRERPRRCLTLLTRALWRSWVSVCPDVSLHSSGWQTLEGECSYKYNAGANRTRKKHKSQTGPSPLFDNI